MRLDKFLANLGYGSRKEVKKLIDDGRILVDGVFAHQVDMKIDENKNKVFVDLEEVYYNPNLVIILNKPKNYVSSNIDEVYPSVLNLIDEKYRRLGLNIAGRLDQDTTGLLILTNNGQILHNLISPNKHIDKVYLVKVESKITDDFVNKMTHDLVLYDKKGDFYITKAKKLSIINDYNFEVTIDEGKYHQVKNMVSACSNNVLELKRLKIGKFTLLDLKEGEYKVLTEDDMLKMLQQ